MKLKLLLCITIVFHDNQVFGDGDDVEESAWPFHKCCSEKSHLSLTVEKQSNDFLELVNYDCVNQINTMYLSERYNPLRRLACNENQILTAVKFKNNLAKFPIEETNICVDFDENFKMYGIYCRARIPGAEKVKNALYRLLRKCCFDDTIYNSEQNKCIGYMSDVNSTTHYNIVNEKTYLAQSLPYNLISSLGQPICDNPGSVIVQRIIDKSELKWTRSEIITIDHVLKISTNTLSYCIDDVYENSSELTSVVIKYCANKYVCDSMTCVRKCCPFGKVFFTINGSEICDVDYNQHPHPLFYSGPTDSKPVAGKHDFGIIGENRCNKGYADDHYLDYESGKMKSKLKADVQYGHDDYCVENIRDLNGSEYWVQHFVCFPPEPVIRKIGTIVRKIGLISSFIALSITIGVYILLSELRNRHGRMLITTMVNLLITFVLFYLVLFIRHDRNGILCVCLAHFLYFCILSTFSWINVISGDLYFQMTSMTVKFRSGHWKSILYCSIYPIGFPLAMTLLVYNARMNDIFPDSFGFSIAETTCFFDEHLTPAHLILFIAPTALQMIVNCIFFLLTAIHFSKIKMNINRIIKTDQSANAKLVRVQKMLTMVFKFFIIMGIPWIGEIVVHYFEESAYTIILDFINTMHGVLIFAVFICKKSIWLKLKRRFGWKGPISSTGVAALQ